MSLSEHVTAGGAKPDLERAIAAFGRLAERVVREGAG